MQVPPTSGLLEMVLPNCQTLSIFLHVLPFLCESAHMENEMKVYDHEIVDQDRKWKEYAVGKLWEERRRMSHTTLIKLKMDGAPQASIYVKKETESASGTLKHRFAWALVMWAVVEGKIKNGTTVYDSTSGNTGASEAYMCRLIGVPYVAVVATSLDQEKKDHIEEFGGKLHFANASERNAVAKELAEKHGGFFINQFANADEAEEYHESGTFVKESTNVFHEISRQLKDLNQSYPDYFIHCAGTGGTISSVGKYINRYSIPTKIILSDSQFSLFYDYVAKDMYTNVSAGPDRPAWRNPGVEGIGYGYNKDPIMFKNTTSLLRTIVDEVVRMPDIASAAAMRSLAKLNMDAGPSTGLNFLVALSMAVQNKKPTSYVLIMGDPGKFYTSTYLNDTWIDQEMAYLGGMKVLNCWEEKIDRAINEGADFLKEGLMC